MRDSLKHLVPLICQTLALLITAAIIITFLALLAFYCYILLGMLL